MSFSFFWDMIVTSVNWEIIRKWGCTNSRGVSRTAMDTIFWETYCAPRWLKLLRVVLHATMDSWIDISLVDPWLRDSGWVSLGQTCIIIRDIAFNRITYFYHWWTRSCVVDSVSGLLWKLWLLNKKLVWGYITCSSVVVELCAM